MQTHRIEANLHPSIKKLAAKLGADGPVKTLSTPRYVKAILGGIYVIKTTNAAYVWEHPYYPQFYVPRSDLYEQSTNRSFTIEEVQDIKSEGGKPVATQLKISIPNSTSSTDQVVAFNDKLSGRAECLQGLVKINFADMDQWFEEDTPIYVHPKVRVLKLIGSLQSYCANAFTRTPSSA